MSLRIAVTGPTGEIGISTIEALEAHPDVSEIVGMARRPFDPAEHHWSKTVYRQGDILDRTAVDELVADADVVIHLAFVIMGSREESARVNLAGTRNVFEATVAAERPRRLVYTSSVAAYGYHRDNPVPITEDVPPRGSPEHYYSEQKAACETALAQVTAGSPLEVYVLRPCIVAGPKAPAMADAMPWNQLPRPRPSDRQGAARVEAALSRIRAHPCNWSTTTTSRRPLRWPPPPRPPRPVPTTSPRRSAVDVRGRRGARRAPCEGAPPRGGGHLGTHRAVAVRPVGTGVAARRPRLGRHGHHQGKRRARLAAEVFGRRDAFGPGQHHSLAGRGPRSKVTTTAPTVRGDMPAQIAIALAAALILAIAGAVLAVRTRRVVTTPTERAVHAALHTASLAAQALRHGLDADSAQRAAPVLRELTGADAVVVYDASGTHLAHDPADRATWTNDALAAAETAAAEALTGQRRILSSHPGRGDDRPTAADR